MRVNLFLSLGKRPTTEMTGSYLTLCRSAQAGGRVSDGNGYYNSGRIRVPFWLSDFISIDVFCIVKLKIRLEFGLGSSWVPNFWVFLAGFGYLKPSLGRAALRPPPKRDQVALLSQLLAQIAIDPHHQ